MSQEVLPPPNIKHLTESEMTAVKKRLDELTEEYDFEGLAKLVEEYPLPAENLDDLKRHQGIEFLLRNRYNLVNALNKYGEQWLEG